MNSLICSVVALNFGSWSRYSLVSRTTSPDSSTSPIRLGMAMSPFMMSENVHTSARGARAPRPAATEKITRYTMAARAPASRSTLRSP